MLLWGVARREPPALKRPANVKTKATPQTDLTKVEKRLIEWRKKHDTQEKVAVAHRKVLLERVVQSMAFEKEAITKARLKALLRKQKANLRA